MRKQEERVVRAIMAAMSYRPGYVEGDIKNNLLRCPVNVLAILEHDVGIPNVFEVVRKLTCN